MYKVILFSNVVNDFEGKMEFIKGQNLDKSKSELIYEDTVVSFMGEEGVANGKNTSNWYPNFSKSVAGNIEQTKENEYLPHWKAITMDVEQFKPTVSQAMALRLANLGKDNPLPVIVENQNLILIFNHQQLEEIPHELVAEVTEL